MGNWPTITKTHGALCVTQSMKPNKLISTFMWHRMCVSSLDSGKTQCLLLILIVYTFMCIITDAHK